MTVCWNLKISFLPPDQVFVCLDAKFVTVSWDHKNAFVSQIWTEYNERDIKDQETSTVNYLPGMGGFLQSIIYGFAGIRIRPEMLEFHHPVPPPGVYQ